MCLAIYKPANVTIDELDYLKAGYKNNSHGAGFAWLHKSRLYIKKGYFNYNDFLDAYLATIEKYNNPAMLIHFRLASLGLLSKENCHPFRIDKNCVFIHNGTFLQEAFYDKDQLKSDTQLVNERVLQPLQEKHYDIINSQDAIRVIKRVAGARNKLIFLNSNNEHLIINENNGFWDNGVWYSNQGYLY